jgi:signal transduction histidine kinase
MTTATDTLLYLYAVAGPDGATFTERSGIEGQRVRAIEEGALVALVSDVPADSFDQPALDENVRDGRWLTPRARAHQEVNAAAHAALAASLPVPFGTIYRSDERIREMLRTRAAELRAKLAALRGRSEWVVGLHRDTVQAADHLAQVRDAMAHVPSSAGPGRKYLEKRRDEGELRAELRRLDEEASLAAHHALGRVSKSSFDEPVVEDAGDLVARTTYVLRGEDEHRFADAVGGFNADWKARGYELRATGPWPAYRSSGAS